MSWRTVVITKPSKLSYKNNFMTIRNETFNTIHISEIGTLVMETTQVSITAYLLSELMKQKVKVIFCDEKHNPSSELVSYYGSHNTSKRIANQIKWTAESKQLLWSKIVCCKIMNQARLLDKYGLPEAEMLYEYAKQIRIGDTSNREGHAAKVYFNALFGKSFSRDCYNNINAILDYGYTILLSAFNREITAMGYMTQIGIMHRNEFNHFNLSSDLMEPFRPIVDEFAYNNLAEVFSQELKLDIVNLLNKKTIIGGKEHFLANAIRLCVNNTLVLLDNMEFDDLCLFEFK